MLMSSFTARSAVRTSCIRRVSRSCTRFAEWRTSRANVRRAGGCSAGASLLRPRAASGSVPGVWAGEARMLTRCPYGSRSLARS